MCIYITSKALSQWTLPSSYLRVVILGASDRAANKTIGPSPPPGATASSCQTIINSNHNHIDLEFPVL